MLLDFKTRSNHSNELILKPGVCYKTLTIRICHESNVLYEELATHGHFVSKALSSNGG